MASKDASKFSSQVSATILPGTSGHVLASKFYDLQVSKNGGKNWRAVGIARARTRGASERACRDACARLPPP